MLKLIDSINYHLWSDALHCRELARTTRNDWDRGTYVRGAIRDSWTAFETVGSEALDAPGLGNSFRTRFDEAVAKKGLPAVVWGQGLWQQVMSVYSMRKEFVHVQPTIDRKKLLTPLSDADKAIDVLRDGIKAVCALVGDPPPMWVEDDADKGWDGKGGLRSSATVTAVRNAVDQDDPNVVRVGFVAKGKEHISDILPADTDHKPHFESLLTRLRVPVSALIAYRGAVLIEKKEVVARGA